MNKPTYKLITGNSAQELKQFPDNHFDSVVTDPPYGINFLGKAWDKDTGEEEVYRECLRVLKPGGHLIAFSAARTYHHLAMAVERSGFEIRDQIMWVYGSGFPKSQDIGKSIDSHTLLGNAHTSSQRKMAMGDEYTPAGHYTIFASDKETELAKASADTRTAANWTAKTPEGKQWSGWGTQLKPAHEPIVMAQKPFPNAIYKNVQKWGVGAINVDACRVGNDTIVTRGGWSEGHDWASRTTYNQINQEHQGRFPANFIHDGSDEVVAMFPGETDNSAARFFYSAKVSRTERNIGCEDIQPNVVINDGREKTCDNAFQRGAGVANNNHPTVKPVALMKYLVQLITPPGGKVLDPFNGSGSTGMACAELGMDYTGIELDANYILISDKRINAWYAKTHPQAFHNPLFTEE